MNSHKPPRTRVWDFPTRIFHLALVAAIAYAWIAVEILEDMQQHFWAGYSVLTLVLFRLAWGVVGTRYARFSSFVYGPKSVWRYFKSFTRKESPIYAGHNPVGGISVVLMILLLLLQASTGLFNSDDYFHGPLSGLVGDSTRSLLGEIHEFSFDVIVAIIALHILAIGFYTIHKKQALIRAMFTGNKEIEGTNAESITHSRLFLALIVLLVCAAGVYLIATGFSDTLPSSEYDYSF